MAKKSNIWGLGAEGGLLFRVQRNLQFIPQTPHRHFVAAFKTRFFQPFAAEADFGHDGVLVYAWEVFVVDG